MNQRSRDDILRAPMGREAKKRTTRSDVARLAGVSTAVVSYVINNGPRPTAPETRARVLKAISELGYHPNAFARGLNTQRSHIIGFIANDFIERDLFIAPYSQAILAGLLSELKEHEHYLLSYAQLVDEELPPLEKLLRSGRLDGVVVRLVRESPATDPLMEMVAASGIPCVCVERPCAGRFGFASVTYADREGARAATHYLVRQGHRRIGYLRGDLRYATGQARLEGYHQALREAGLQMDDALVQSDSWDIGAAANGVRRLLDLAAPPTAIFSASDNLALTALNVLHERGIDVPQDVALVGFDDIELASHSWPPLTTMRIPLVELGRQAASMVMRLVGGEQEVGDINLPVELIRRSTA